MTLSLLNNNQKVVVNMFYVVLVTWLIPSVTSFDKIFMGHATNQPGFNFVCHQRTVFNTLGGEIVSQKNYYESDLKDCNILLTSPPGTQIDFRFTDIEIIASNLNTCFDASLRIYDGRTNASSLLLGFPNGICGQAVPSFHIRSTSNSMLLELSVTSPYTSSFSAVYTAYSPRTSVLCFYCDDLCLPESSQICDGFQNCRDGEDENSCNAKPPTIPKQSDQTEEDLKLILIFVFGGISTILLVLVIAILSKKQLTKYCLEKRRQRRAAAAANLMLHPPLAPHMYSSPHLSGRRAGTNNASAVPPGRMGFNRPFMAGPTIPNSARAAHAGIPRSNLPPPYSSLPPDTVNVNRNNTGVTSQTNAHDPSPNYAHSVNPLFDMDDEPRPHISDEDDTPTNTISNTVFNYNNGTGNGEANQVNQIQETSFIEETPTTQSNADSHIEVDNNATSSDHSTLSTNNAVVTSSYPENAINNSYFAGTLPDMQDSRTDTPTSLTEVIDSSTDATNSVTDVPDLITDSSISVTDAGVVTNFTDPSTDETVVRPVNEIDNAPVDVSTRDTIYDIEDLNIGLGNQGEEETGHGEIIYI